jgi:coproporphyrinogen III oxidase-like Fe-S oxidoreductase
LFGDGRKKFSSQRTYSKELIKCSCQKDEDENMLKAPRYLSKVVSLSRRCIRQFSNTFPICSHASEWEVPSPRFATFQNPSAFGVYIHYPYCRKRCSYCNFNIYEIGKRKSLQAQRETQAYQFELETSLQEIAPFRSSLSSIYFGGGTPSLASIGILQSFGPFCQINDEMLKRTPVRRCACLTCRANTCVEWFKSCLDTIQQETGQQLSDLEITVEVNPSVKILSGLL